MPCRLCTSLEQDQQAPTRVEDRERWRFALALAALSLLLGPPATGLAENEQRCGFTANSFSSVSLDPPLILVCIGTHAGSHPVFAVAEHFAVNILSQTQRELSNRFASKHRDKVSSTRENSREVHQGKAQAIAGEG